MSALPPGLRHPLWGRVPLAFPLGTRLEIQKTCEPEEEVGAVTPPTWETAALECVLEKE